MSQSKISNCFREVTLRAKGRKIQASCRRLWALRREATLAMTRGLDAIFTKKKMSTKSILTAYSNPDPS